MTGYRIIAMDKEQHFAFAEKVVIRDWKRIECCVRVEVIDHKGRAWNEPMNRILINPKIIKEVSSPWLYKVDLTEVGDNASE